MLDALEASFDKGEGGAAPEPLGPGLYGPSLFYRGIEAFHIFNVCNHWVARLLSAAGVPTAPVLATLPSGLFLDCNGGQDSWSRRKIDCVGYGVANDLPLRVTLHCKCFGLAL